MIFGKHINKYYAKYGFLLLFGLLALILVDVAQLRVPEVYRMVVNGMNTGYIEVDGVTKVFDMEALLMDVCFPLCIIVLIMVTGRFAWRIGFFGSAIRVEAALRDEMFDHAKDLSQQYYSVNKVGDLMSLFTNDLETVQDCFGSGGMTLVDAAFLGSLAFIKMFRMNIVLTLFSLIPMALMFVMAVLIGKRMSDKWEERQEKFSALSDFSQESFTGIAVIKAFAKEVKELHAFKGLNKENEVINVQFVRYRMLMDILIEMFITAVLVVILGYGGYLVYTGVFNAGELIEFIGYFNAIIWPILAISMLIDMSARGKASMKRISEFLDAPIDVKDNEEVSEKAEKEEKPFIADFKGEIEFRNLTFAYPGTERNVLTDVSFKINAGENVGLIGRTGSGKTTIVDLMARTYNVPDGTIFMDGVDVNRFPIHELRDHIAYVPQDNFLFSQRISDNIAFAFQDTDVNPHTKEIEEAAKLSDVYGNIVEFPEKFDTILGERGVTVSGGQKQRISIARAMMKNGEIMILDDSVSAVDTATERTIIDNLKKTRKGRTTILIAHRITTIEKMDKIIFIDDGKVVDIGSHKELSERCEAYKEMVEMQRLEDERKELNS